MSEVRCIDGDGGEVLVHGEEAATLWTLTRGFEDATVSACPECGSRVVASVAIVDLLERALPHSASDALIALAEEAPTLHLYLAFDAAKILRSAPTDPLPPRCTHDHWRDPGFDEYCDAFGIRRRSRQRRNV